MNGGCETYQICYYVTNRVGSTLDWLEQSRGWPRKWVLRLPMLIFWLGLFLPVQLAMYTTVLPYAGSASLKTSFAASSLLHVVLYWLVAGSDPGVVRISPQQTEQLLAAGCKGQICRQTGQLQPVRSKYIEYSGQLIGRFDHYCDWCATAEGRASTLAAAAHCGLLQNRLRVSCVALVWMHRLSLRV